MKKVLIIEDEQPTALDLGRMLQQLDPEIEVMAIADTVVGAVAQLQKAAGPDLIFMDIQLADGLSFEIFELTEVNAPVVFCTAFDEYALQAFHVNGIDYLLKPFDIASIERALHKVQNLKNFFQQDQDGAIDRITAMLQQLKGNYKTSFLVSHRDKLLPIATEQIAYFYIENEITFLHTFDGHRYLINATLDELEKSVNPSNFYRANRQYLVNFQAISEITHYFARKLLLKLNTTTKEPVVVSKAKSGEFLEWMERR